jgi:8-oxo-dGTP pyrophosphatase MutT (NUDIX family)
MENYRKSVFVVVYAKEGNEIKYLLLERKLHWKGWEFPKGGVDKGENEIQTVKRETREETGLNIKGEIKNFGIEGRYKYSKTLPDRPGFIGQSYSLYAVEVVKGKIKLDPLEHSGYEWLGFKDALKKLKWKNQKKCLQIVNGFLENKNFRKRITKNGVLLLAGKDENTNDELVKQAGKDEFLFHTEMAGSPFVNVKGRANEEDLREAALFCAKHSRAWKNSMKDVEVHKFKGADTYKSRGMKAGTFGVRNFEKVKLKKEDIENFK